MDELLELIGLDPHEVRDRYPAQLSGGQRQRVGVARALAVDPPVMLMDEPFGAIDPINRERLQNEFLRLQAELRKTIVFVTHDIDEAIKMGDRIAVMQVGRQARAVRAAGRAADRLRPTRSSRTSSAPTARSSASRCSACATSTCGRSRPAAPASRSPRCASASRTPTSRSPLLVDEEQRPLGWLSERGLTGERVRPELRSPADPIVELDDILRDALSDLLAHESMYGPVDRRPRARRRRAVDPGHLARGRQRSAAVPGATEHAAIEAAERGGARADDAGDGPEDGP